MENNYIYDVKTQFENLVLNAEGIEKELYEYISENEIFKAIDLMVNNDREVNNALKEYNPQTHPIMKKPNKYRKNNEDYITEKLPRSKQRYINEIELFFLLGKPLEWSFRKGEEEAFNLFCGFWKKYRLDALMRKAKRLAGAETESALIFHLSRSGEELSIKPFVAARSTGYRLRPLFDQYGTLLALAYGYRVRSKGKNVLHWDILTSRFTFYCEHTQDGWKKEVYENPTGKINAVYFSQLKAWDGTVPRLEREEKLDSDLADNNNYFMNPIAKASADVIENLGEPDRPGRLIQLTGNQSQFEYINPPSDSQGRASEKTELHRTTLFDTFTPDFSYENMKGLGTLSGAAMRNALILGYMKRDNRIETYGEMVSRLVSVIKELIKLTNAAKATIIEAVEILFEFADPFGRRNELWNDIQSLYKAGLISLETAIRMLDLTDDDQAEINRIRMEALELEAAKIEMQAELADIQAQMKAQAEEGAE